MGRVAILMLLAGAGYAASAQQPCEFFGDQAREHTIQALQAAATCKEAAARFDKCRWGSSADAEFGSIVIDKCAKELVPQLSATGKANYQHELRLCSYEYAQQQGTVFLSEEWQCAVNVAADFAANPDLANEPPARASFDCARAQSTFEEAICSDPKLGDADIVLSRVLHGAMSALRPAEKRELTKQQMQWFIDAEQRCGVGGDALSASARGCMVKEYQGRFRELDGCSVGETAACLKLPEYQP